VLAGEGAVRGDPAVEQIPSSVSFLEGLSCNAPASAMLQHVPVFRIMRFLQRVADAGVASGEDALPLARHAGRIQLDFHQLVHVLGDQHVAVELDDALVLDQAEGG